MSIFKKREKVPINVLADGILELQRTRIQEAVQNLASIEEFRDIEKDNLHFEFTLLAFWDLNLLGYPLDLFQCVVNQFIEHTKFDRASFLKIAEERSKSYFDAWGMGKSGDSLQRLLFALARNIDDKLALDLVAILQLTPFFTSLNMMNAKFLKSIRTNMEIIPARIKEK